MRVAVNVDEMGYEGKSVDELLMIPWRGIQSVLVQRAGVCFMDWFF